MDHPQEEIALIEKMLWEDQGLAAYERAKALKASHPTVPEVTALLSRCAEWIGHTVSKDAYKNFYTGHRRAFVDPDQMHFGHERIPRLGLVRSWMTEHPPQSILDLGCFDGWAIINLCQATGALGFGVDLDEEALKHAAKASAQLGLNIKWIASMAEDIDLGLGFDAILIMEILEHVLDPLEVLQVAERHLSPGGRIYITTPGTPVPHLDNEKEAREHLRCLASVDLLELLEGRVVERFETLQPAHHQEQVVCYRRPRTTFVVNPVAGGWDPRHGKTYRGSEEGVVGLARELAKVGHEVELYLNVSGEEKEFEGMRGGGFICRDHSLFNPADPRDILIIKKLPELLDAPLNARTVFFWTTDPNRPEHLTPGRLAQVTKVVALTEWHRKELLELNPTLPPDKVTAIPYGIPDVMIRMPMLSLDRPPAALVYASSYDRGLERLLDWWPAIREQVPDAELHIWYGWSMYDQINNLVGVTAFETDMVPGIRAAWEWKSRMLEKMQQPGIVVHEETTPYDPTPFLEAAIWAYPCIGGERFCLTAVKAQALGAIPVVVPTMALDETVKWGIKTDHEHFVEELVALMKDPARQMRIREKMVEARLTS